MASRVMSDVDGMRKGSQFHVTITAETHTPVHRKPCLVNIDNWQIYSPRGKRPGVECPTIWNVSRDKAAVSYFCLLERRIRTWQIRHLFVPPTKFNRRTGTSNPRVLLLLDVRSPPIHPSPRWQHTLRTRCYPLTWSVEQPVIVVGPPRRKR